MGNTITDSHTLVTGANGEFGHALVKALYERGARNIVALDLHELSGDLKPYCVRWLEADIKDPSIGSKLEQGLRFHTIFHLAALLSTRSEREPELAHDVNVVGTARLLHVAACNARRGPVRFLFPSSIAAYGIKDLATKCRVGKVNEDQFLEPITMYGCNKLACEHLGRYYRDHYRLLDGAEQRVGVDFRSIRFPGVISAMTLPTGGTSDFGPEMIHAAARGMSYSCFVRSDTRIPFMTMSDAIDSLLRLEAADRDGLSRCVYNVTAFNPSAKEIAERVQGSFPDARIEFRPDPLRQEIVDSWPENVDDSAARRDFGHAPSHDFERAFSEYLLPGIRDRYRD